MDRVARRPRAPRFELMDGTMPHPGRLLFRFAIGLAELAGQGLVTSLRVFEETRQAEDDETGVRRRETLPPFRARHVLFGAASAVPGWIAARFARRRRNVAAPPVGPGRAARGHAYRLLARAPGVDRARRGYLAWRARLAAQIGAQVGAWAAVGRREEQKGRALAREALIGYYELAMARIADSPELKQVIGEQSQGLAVSAVTGLRDGSARADDAIETVARRLLRRLPGTGGRR
jgi:hypothetical protein